MIEDWLKAILFADLADGISHGVCVSNLTYLTAERLGLEEHVRYDLALAGMLHDIGKLRLSAQLYGRNSNGMMIEEIRYMRMHSQLGYEILKKHAFSDFIAESVLYHHENYDGSGYPGNLKAEQIPFGARVIKVADSFAALISERPYREAFDFDTAIGIMIEDIREYDMRVFLAFQEIIHDSSLLDSIRHDQLLIDYNMEDAIL